MIQFNMKLFVNLSSINKGGAEQVALSFLNECRDFGDHTYYIFLCNNLSSQLDLKSFSKNFLFFLIDERPGKSLKSYLRFIKFLNVKENEIKPDCVVSTSSHGYWKPKFTPIVAGFNIPHFVYPESPYFNKLSLTKRWLWDVKKKFHIYFYNRLDTIFVQTEDVKNRLKRIINKSVNIITISNTVNAHYLSPKMYPKKLGNKKEEEYRLLTLSSYYPHKNFEIISSIIDIFIEKNINKFKFIVTLPENKFNILFGKYPKNMIINVGRVPIQECSSLYKECDAMFLPTLLECFSASYAEAMLLGKPILTSDLGFAHNVCKDAAVFFDPCDPNDIINKLMSLSQDVDLQLQLINRGYIIIGEINSAKERATKILNICEQTVNSN